MSWLGRLFLSGGGVLECLDVQWIGNNMDDGDVVEFYSGEERLYRVLYQRGRGSTEDRDEMRVSIVSKIKIKKNGQQK